MKEISLTLVNYSYLKKVKPLQNLLLILTAFFWILSLTLSFFNNVFLTEITVFLIFASFLTFFLFIVFSIPFLFKSKVGEATIIENSLLITKDGKKKLYSLNAVEFKFNIDKRNFEKESWTEKSLKKLPKWGNYIILGSDNPSEKEFEEFQPTVSIFPFLPQIKACGFENRPFLMEDTRELLKKLIWMIWGAS